jgi:hypothetical protein
MEKSAEITTVVVDEDTGQLEVAAELDNTVQPRTMRVLKKGKPVATAKPGDIVTLDLSDEDYQLQLDNENVEPYVPSKRTVRVLANDAALRQGKNRS